MKLKFWTENKKLTKSNGFLVFNLKARKQQQGIKDFSLSLISKILTKIKRISRQLEEIKSKKYIKLLLKVRDLRNIPPLLLQRNQMDKQQQQLSH